MIRTIALRLLYVIPIMLVVTTATFFMIELLPGDPATVVVGQDATADQIAAVRAELHLDDPLWDRYTSWMGDTIHGDLGQTLKPPTTNVGELLGERLPVTIEIAVLAMCMSLLLSIPLGILMASRAGTRLDRLAGVGPLAMLSIPNFLAAYLLIFFLVFNTQLVKPVVLAGGVVLAAMVIRSTVTRAGRYGSARHKRRVLVSGVTTAVVVGAAAMLLVTNWPTFPRQGFAKLSEGASIGENLRSAFLPAFTIALAETAVFSRLLRNDMAQTLREDYILAARAKGTSLFHILTRDALRPSLFSLVTVAGVSFGRLIGGAVIVERIYNVPGVGPLLVDSIASKDLRVVQGVVLVLAAFYVVINALVDISYSLLDPRLRRDPV